MYWLVNSFGGQVDRYLVLRGGGVPDGVEEMRLAEADAGVEEERVVAPPRVFGHGQGRRVGQVVRLAHDE